MSPFEVYEDRETMHEEVLSIVQLGEASDTTAAWDIALNRIVRDYLKLQEGITLRNVHNKQEAKE